MEEEIDKFYSTLDNAKVRKEQVGAIVVKFKLGTGNKCSERWVQWHIANDQTTICQTR